MSDIIFWLYGDPRDHAVLVDPATLTSGDIAGSCCGHPVTARPGQPGTRCPACLTATAHTPSWAP